MLVISDTSVVPGEKFHFPVTATGVDIYAPNYPALFSMVQQHCIANNVSYPGDQAIIDFLCLNTHVPCYQSETRKPLVNAFLMQLPLPPTSCCGK